MVIPQRFQQTITEVYGPEGRQWLHELPDLVSAFERRWSLKVGPPFSELSYNYAAPAVREDGTGVVLKLGVPNPELVCEAEALRLFGGRGAVLLLEADAPRGALLLERVLPGTPLSAMADDEEATSIAAQVMRELWRQAPERQPFPSVADWAAGLGRLRARFGGGTGPLPGRLVEEAEAIFAELIPCMARRVLLHGDLHHDNILAAQRRPWLALDPKGVVGEPEYEVGSLLRNPMPQLLSAPSPKEVISRRLEQLASELGFAQERLRRWGLAQAVLFTNAPIFAVLSHLSTKTPKPLDNRAKKLYPSTRIRT